MTGQTSTRRAFKPVLRLIAAFTFLILVYAIVVAFPKPMFEYRVSYRNYEIYSDEPIAPQIAQVLDDTDRRLKTSAIHDSRVQNTIFFCNAPWRLWLYSGNFSTKVGATTHALTNYIFVRPSDIPANRIHPPGAGPIADAAQRPLSYFLAHEVTHADVFRRFGPWTAVVTPQWLGEGYPDYVAKAGDFDFATNRALYLAGRPEMDVRRSGLYRGFHLRVAYLLDQRHMTIAQVFADPPGDASIEKWLSE
ncbi:MAG: hypothetical protein ACLGI6_03565 [Gammaproteobacteria bacterium]